MRYLKHTLFIFIISFFAGYTRVSAQSNQKAMHIQVCLNDMYKSKMFDVIAKPVILIKNDFSKGLENLHIGKNKFFLKDIIGHEKEIYANDDNRKLTYLSVVDYAIKGKEVEIAISIPGMTLGYSLIKRKNQWVIKDYTMAFDDTIDEPEMPNN